MNDCNPHAIILAGGKGERLDPLTRDRVKPAVPFAGKYQIIDFQVSNLINSGIFSVDILTQGSSFSLQRNLDRGAKPLFGNGPNNSLTVIHSNQGDLGEDFLGTADAVWQTRDRFQHGISPILVFPGDHICFMDVRPFSASHCQSGADLTICAKPVPVSLAAGEYGVLVVDNDGRVKGFEEKPSKPTPIPGQTDMCLASMGIYAFRNESLLESLAKDQCKMRGKKDDVKNDPSRYSTRDFGFDIIPHMLRSGAMIQAYDFSMNAVKGMEPHKKGYWRDVGNVDELYKANMEVCSVDPPLNLYDMDWPVHTGALSLPSAKYVHLGTQVINSVVSDGCIISEAAVVRSVLSPSVRAQSGSRIEESVIFHRVNVGMGAKIYKSIIDKDVTIPEGFVLNADTARNLSPRIDRYWKDGMERIDEIPVKVTDSGIVVIPKGYKFPGQQ